MYIKPLVVLAESIVVHILVVQQVECCGFIPNNMSSL